MEAEESGRGVAGYVGVLPQQQEQPQLYSQLTGILEPADRDVLAQVVQHATQMQQGQAQNQQPNA